MKKEITLDELVEDIKDICYDRSWCEENNLDYSNLDISEVIELRMQYYLDEGYKLPIKPIIYNSNA